MRYRCPRRVRNALSTAAGTVGGTIVGRNLIMNGKLKLSFERDRQSIRTILTDCEQLPPLRVIRAFSSDDGQSLVHLHNLSGGILGGDRLELDISAGIETDVQITSTGATRLYKGRQGAANAAQKNLIRINENALLEFVPDPLIPFAGSKYLQETEIELADGAGLFWWETIAPGREAFGELFRYDRLQFNLDLKTNGMLIARERFRLEPRNEPLLFAERFGAYRYFSTFYICRVGLESVEWLKLELALSEMANDLSKPSEILWGVSTLPAHGLVIRVASIGGRAVTSGLLEFWRAAKLSLYGRLPILPRKVY